MGAVSEFLVRREICLTMFFDSRSHHVRALAIRQGITSGRLTPVALARQIIGRALKDGEIKPAIIREYQVSLDALSRREKATFFPRLTAALRQVVHEDELERSAVRTEAAGSIIFSLGLERG